jgi:hypothetical protein
MGDQVLVAPPGITRPDQFVENNTERMPTPPRQANSLIVGGPAYFTPEGYQAPYQPEQSFMPTNVAPDPIRDQFNRMYPTPPPPPPAPAPAPAPTPVYEPVVEPVAGPDPVTEPVVEPVVPPGAYPPYIPGVTPFPGIPGLGDLDFSGLPGMGDIDMDRIIQEYQDRIDAGEPEPFDSFLPPPPAGLNPFNPPPGGFEGPQPGSSAPAGFIPPAAGSMNTMAFVDYYNPTTGETWSAPNGGWTAPEGWEVGSPPGGLKNTFDGTVTPEPVFTPPPTMPEPNGFFPGIDPRDFKDFEDFDFGNIDIPNYQMPAPTMPAPQAQAPTAAPIYTPPPSRIETPQMGGRSKFDFSNLGNFNLR